MRSPAALLAAFAAAGIAGSAAAAPSDYDVAFVAEFEKACVPGRLTYEASQAAALAAGWTVVTPDVHPELQAIMELAGAEALDTELTDPSFEYTAYTKKIESTEHHLVVDHATFVIGEPDDPLNPWVYVGCYLYNLDATVPLDPEPVTALIGNPVSETREGDGVVSHVWGPPCPMPRTGDTYLNFVADGSELAGQVPFTGIALNFTTSALDPGAEPPDPYC